MRLLRLAALAALALLASPAGSAATSAFSVSCAASPAGSDVPCTVTRTSGGKGIYVYFATSDGTAMAGMDYTAVKQLLYFRASQLTQTVVVHTAVNPSATGTLTFTASIAASSVPASATGSIVEPTPAMAMCPDGSMMPESGACAAPPAPPGAQWVPAPLKNGGYARCKTVGGCHGFAAPYPDIIAQQGDIMMYAWNGVTACETPTPCRTIAALWPQGQYETSTPYVGVEGFADEWEGVAPAS